jgi:HD-GYP domain-containing protein (c-di-GMP phosphodiesterase class II)
MVYIPVPLNRLQIGKPLPVDVWTPDGRLLLRRGQILQSLSHRDMLAAHHACTTEADSRAWQRSLERSMRSLRAAGVDMALISRAPMPYEILDTDYLEGSGVDGGWLDLQEVLRSLLYQGADATQPLTRLQGLEEKALKLLRHDPDEALFELFQALPDLNLGYCATHALLAGVVCALAAEKIAHPEESPSLLLRSAMVMNIGMARPQDSLTRQYQPPDSGQRQIIDAHPPTSTEILRGFGVSDEEVLGVVNWHHTPEQAPLRWRDRGQRHGAHPTGH